MQYDERSGLGLRDVIVVIVVLNLVAILGLPAIEYARDSARNHTCANNLSRLGVALHAYHDQFTCLPPAAVWGSEGLDLPELFSHKEPTPVHVTRENWVQLVLPFLGEAELASRFDRSVPVVDPHNRVPRTQELALMACPSDNYNRSENQYELTLPNSETVHFARGNYAINGGSEYVPAQFGTLSNPGPTKNRYVYSEETREFQWWGNGVAGINKCFSFDDFDNGLGTTVLLEEIRAGIDPIDPRGSWALGQIGGSITWGHGVTGDDLGPNYQQKDSGADDIIGGPDLVDKLGEDFIRAEQMSICTYCNENFQATARSKHSGGVNVLMADGAIHFVSNEIEPTLWHVMHSREADPGIFDESFVRELAGNYDYGEAKTFTSTPTPNLNSAKSITNSIGMRFRLIPTGTFEMGVANQDHRLPFPEDAVSHTVAITQPYYLGIHEVTQQQFAVVMGDNPSWHAIGGKYQHRIKIDDTSQCPVDNVSWNDAAEFCENLSNLPEERQAGRRYRLPTEAEWEYCCRANREEAIKQNIHWDPDDTSGEIANKELTPEPLCTVPVGSYPRNGFGMHDMCGNVFEWVADYRSNGYYARAPSHNPQGPAKGYLRVIRGWYWIATGPHCKVYVANDPWTGNPFIGFRVVCEHLRAGVLSENQSN
ncbi:SUMF1/EgtB/PvdO family nonheme iron enzyme [Symmachiella dynata]|uniref:SUMF1/EgtB/PvdO family nonheme iron enzyme n=1 Tax=Symmachiella dynata TaxID=2527995 RepID=UPI0030EEA4D0